MTPAGRTLIVGGLALAVWAMTYGLWFALFDEHQTLERLGASLTHAFESGAARDLTAAGEAIDRYQATQFEYVREVDVHSHWAGLAMLLIVLGAVLERAGGAPRRAHALALALVVGSAVFPLGVIMQTWSDGALPRAIAAAGAGVVTLALAAMAIGFAKAAPSAGE